MILPVAVCESLTLKEQQCSRMLYRGKVFVPSREEVTGYWRKMNNEEPRDFYCASDNIRFVKT